MIFAKKKILVWCDDPPEDPVISIFAGCPANHDRAHSHCKFLPLIAMYVHDMIRHVLTTLYFVDVSSILDKLDIYASDRRFSPLIAMYVHDMIRHVLTILCFVHVSSILDHLEIYASGCKFSPLIAMHVHDMIRHVLTNLYFVDVSSMPISTSFVCITSASSQTGDSSIIILFPPLTIYSVLVPVHGGGLFVC